MMPRKVVRIAIMGLTGSGKSSLIRTITACDDVVIGHGMKSQTTEAISYPVTIEDTEYILIDTPGFNDTTRSDEQILEHITTYLSGQFTKNELLSGIIYLHPINRDRFQGTDILQANVLKQFCGSEALQSMIFATTFWEHVDKAVGEARETELAEDLIFEDLVKHCAGTARIVHNDRTSSIELIESFKNNGEVILAAQKETAAGSESGASKLLNAEKRKLEAEKQKGIEARERKAAEELAEQKRRQQAEAERRRKEQEEADRQRRRERENREREASLERWRARRRQEELEKLEREAIEREKKLAAERAEQRRRQLELARLRQEAEEENRRRERIEAELREQHQREAAERRRIDISRESFRAKGDFIFSRYRCGSSASHSKGVHKVTNALRCWDCECDVCWPCYRSGKVLAHGPDCYVWGKYTY